jgi:large subunit ribosomal protein L15
MNITDVLKKSGRSKRRKRVGRGVGSGHGKTSTRGAKGLKARAGGAAPLMYEGGQMPLFRRIPKRGFSNAQFRTVYQPVNVGDLEAKFEAGTKVTAAVMEAAGLISDACKPVKVLGDGELKKKLDVEATGFSKTAEAKITQAGGQARKTG